jgi:hypothetical protein
MKDIVRVIVWSALALAAFYTLLEVTVGVSFYRAVPLANDPLTNSVLVTSVSSNRFTLADGRVLVMEGYGEPLDRAMREAGYRVELESNPSGSTSVFMRKKRFICGTHAPVVVPLLRQEYPAYYRHPLGWGTLQ